MDERARAWSELAATDAPPEVAAAYGNAQSAAFVKAALEHYARTSL